MRRLFGFLAVVLISATTLFAQHHSSGSSSSSSGNSSSSSSSSSPSYSPPSYSPPASSGSSRSSDSGSRSSDSGSRNSSSSSSSSSGGTYTPPSHNSSEPSSRGSSTSSSGSSYHPSSNNSSGYSNSGNMRDSRSSGAQVQNRREFPANTPSREPASNTFRGTEQPTSRGSILPGNNRADVNPGHNGQTSSTSKMPYDPELLNKYRPKESKLLEKQSRLDEQSNKLYTKYKLAGKDAEYARKQEKLDKERGKLQDKELKLAKKYQLEAEKKSKPCTVKDCPSPCPPGATLSRHGGCVPTPGTQNPQCGPGSHQDGTRCVTDTQCQGGYRWDGHACVQDALDYSSSLGTNCGYYYSQLRTQEKILNDLKRSQAAACGGNSSGADCSSYTQQVLAAETIYRQLQEEYSRCLMHP